MLSPSEALTVATIRTISFSDLEREFGFSTRSTSADGSKCGKGFVYIESRINDWAIQDCKCNPVMGLDPFFRSNRSHRMPANILRALFGAEIGFDRFAERLPA